MTVRGRSTTLRRSLLSALGLGLWSAPTRVQAFETPPLGDTPVQVDVTESLSLSYHGDNRNDRRADVASQADDDWGLVSNRIEARANWKAWQLGLRLDSAWFYTSRSATDISLGLLELEHGGRLPDTYEEEDADLFVQKFFQAGDELSDRFVSWSYPAKLSLTYSTRELEATLGDFYAQFGRGLVLSVRKQDELASDTTLRGARATGTLRMDDLRFRLTALAGTANPLRVDEASGRHLGTTGDVRDGLAAWTEAGMPRMTPSSFDPEPRPNFAPDLLYGFELSARTKPAGLSFSGTRLERQCAGSGSACEPLANDLVRAAGVIDTFGVALDLPDLWGHGAFYVEIARQRLSDYRTALGAQAPDATEGGAVYGSLNLHQRPVAFTLEGKHYRNFHPLRANVDIGSAREFTPVQYSSPPTTMPVWSDTEFDGFNLCVTGGRARVDLELAERISVFGWVGRYDTWGESVAVGTCDAVDDNLNRIWDFAQGFELGSADRASRAEALVGSRFDATDREILDPQGEPTQVFYRELYARHHFVRRLVREVSASFEGWHRRRRQTLGGPDEPWFQGTTVTGLQLGTRWGLALGFEYDQNPAFPDLYLNGQLRYEFEGLGVPWQAGPSSLVLFAGQRQGGLRCVSGVCRVYPPFEGVRLDLTLGF